MHSKYRYKRYADYVFLFHILFIVYFTIAAYYSLHHPIFAFFQCLLVIGTIAVPHFLGACPITLWEIHYRKLHDPNHEYTDNSFYSHYVFGKLLGMRISQRRIDVILFITKIIPNIIPFLVVFHRL